MKNIVILLISLLSLSGVKAQWHQINSNTSEDISGMVFTNQNTGFFVSGENIYKSNDAGENWSLNFQGTGIEFTDVVATTSQIICFAHNTNQEWFTYTSTDGGNSWSIASFSHKPYSIQYQNDLILFTDANDGLKLKKITNNQVSTILDHSTVLFGIDQNEITAVNETYDTIYKSEDYGGTWAALPDFPSNFTGNNANWSQIKSFGDTIVLTASYGPSVHFSTNDGSSWEKIYDENIPTTNIILDSGVIYGMSQCNENGSTVSCITGSNDYGQNWQVIQSGLNGGFTDYKFYFFNDDLGFAFTKDGVVYKTSNGGGLSVKKNREIEKNIKLYPNPSKDQVFIKTGSLVIKDLELFNLQGRRIQCDFSKVSRNTLKVNTNSLAPGQYIIKIKTAQNKSVKKRMVVE